MGGVGVSAYLSGGGGRLFEAGRLSTFLACVAGAKRGGGGGREIGKREGRSPPPLPNPPPLFPFLPIPYPLPLSTPATQATTFSAFRMGAYSRWALIRGWALTWAPGAYLNKYGGTSEAWHLVKLYFHFHLLNKRENVINELSWTEIAKINSQQKKN